MLTYRSLALPIALFPIILFLGIMLIPIVTNYADHDLAQTAARQTNRWFWGHLLSGLAFGLGLIAIFCISLHLWTQQFTIWPLLALPLTAIGAALLTAGLGADAIGPLAINRAGYAAHLFFDGSRSWIVGTFVAGSIIFGLGQILLLIGVQHTPLLSTPMGITIQFAAILFSISTAIPSGWGLYVLGTSALVIYLPISYAFWQSSGYLFVQTAGG